MADKYDEIINLPHHVSPTREQMSPAERAAQFSPFAALTGFESAVKESGRATEDKIELGESDLAELNGKIRLIEENIADFPEIEFTYFKPDGLKSGGSYLTCRGRVKKLNEFRRLILLDDGTEIPLDGIYSMEGELFR